MKKIFTMLAVAGLAFGVQAQQGGYDNYFGLTLGGGLNSMTFSPKNGDQNMGLGFDAGLHYVHFFGSTVGLGFGVHYTNFNATANYNFSGNTNVASHPNNPGVSYILHSQFNDWKEHQTIGTLGIPVELFFRSVINDTWTFIFGIGGELDIPLHGSYGVDDGSYTTTGTFPALGNLVVSDAPEHGFSTYNETFDAKIDSIKLTVSAIADMGFRMALGSNWGLYFGVYGGFGLNNTLKHVQSSKPLVEIDPNDARNIQYNGTFNSNEITTTGRVRQGVHLVRAGIKIGIDLGWDDRSTIAKRKAEQEAIERAAAEAAAAEAAAAKAAAEKAAREKAAAEKAAADRAAAEAAAAKAEADRLAAERAAAQAAADKAAAENAADRAAAERLAAERAAAERAAAEKAARERAEKAKAEAVKQIQAINATVYFATAGTEAKFDAVTDGAIHAICEALKADENLNVTVFGHTDNTGSHKVNMKYGQKRAEALKNYMVKLGAPAKSIKCVSKGPDEPVADNGTEEGRAKNRRATVELKELK